MEVLEKMRETIFKMVSLNNYQKSALRIYR